MLTAILLSAGAATSDAASAPCKAPGTRQERGKALRNCPPTVLPRERLDTRLGAGRDVGTMRFGDTEMRIGGRASFSAGYAR
ncbi:hypothetical protein GCM10010994_15540 [Chelatococcus reniformis]|uniref:Porin n=1 Tax=Chelatococcus reniformis TaxID=1494448 RepID=A0A916X9J7_9HYPH|nr:hypothetical protein GCM10010994_15540 [Chelatococcus reniformis]